jgi:hypothetical protein
VWNVTGPTYGGMTNANKTVVKSLKIKRTYGELNIDGQIIKHS